MKIKHPINIKAIIMETNGQLSETSYENALSNTQCRLHLLNHDCLLKVFEFLDINDLMQLCKTDVHFKALILDSFLIGTKVFDWRNGLTRSSNNEILQTFGKSMKKFITNEHDFNEFLESVTKYCAPKKLTSVMINLTGHMTGPDMANLHTIQLSMPYFSNLLKLSLSGYVTYINSIDEFLLALSLTAKNLQQLTLYRSHLAGGWCTTSRMENLRELRIIRPYEHTFSISDFKSYLCSLPQLEVFVYDGFPVDIADIGRTLTNYCPNLNKFQYCTGSDSVHRVFPFDIFNSYNFLASFSNLNTVSLTSFTYCGCDLYDPLTMLATTNIDKLRVFFDFGSSEVNKHIPDCNQRIMNSSFKKFVSLKVLALDVKNNNSHSNSDLHCEFLLHMASQLKNLVMFTLQSHAFSNAYKIFEMLPQVRTFSIFRSDFKHSPVFMLKTARHLRTVRQKNDINDESNLVKLIVTELQWRELKVHKDIEKFAKIIIVDPLERNTKGKVIID